MGKTKGLRTSKQLAKLQEKRTALLRLIQNWREVQLVYMPHVASLIQGAPVADGNGDATSVPSDTFAENIPLFLPSSLPARICALPELQEICKLERRLREPQADDALAEVRRQRRIIQGLWQFKRLNVSGTGNRPNTRMLTLYTRFNNKTLRAAEAYRLAWRALCILDPNGSWGQRLKELKPSDISGPGKDPNDVSTKSRYEPSWIWLAPRVTERHGNTDLAMNEQEFNNSMCVEWAKARARMNRWKEEVLLIQEEMRRVLAYHEWRNTWWQERSSIRKVGDATIQSGLAGYAKKQATISQRMGEVCAAYWLPHLKDNGIVPSWASRYMSVLASSPVDGEENRENDKDGETDIEHDVEVEVDVCFDLDD